MNWRHIIDAFCIVVYIVYCMVLYCIAYYMSVYNYNTVNLAYLNSMMTSAILKYSLKSYYVIKHRNVLPLKSRASFIFEHKMYQAVHRGMVNARQ